MTKIFMVAGLGFGDEGKGSITEYLTRRERAHTVVRYNGGAQAAHNVVRSDGTHHTFSQFGSGTFEGAATHLSRFVIIDPTALEAEGLALKEHGISNVFERLTIEDKALLITPYQKGANRLREILRRQNRHGSCGVGIGETVSDSLSYTREYVPTAADLKNRTVLEEKLSFVRDLKLKEFASRDLYNGDPSYLINPAFNLLTISVTEVAECWMEIAKKIQVVSDNYLNDVIIRKPGPVIFEGAQGVLLDQNWGFHPHTTWTDTTFSNAHELLYSTSEKYAKYTKVGVIRTYMTRHGHGPFPSEIKGPTSIKLSEPHNAKHEWQGNFRVGFFDMVLFRYALSVIEQVDYVALTHMDVLPKLNRMCISYGEHGGDVANYLDNGGLNLKKRTAMNLEYSECLGKALQHSGLDLRYWPVNNDFVAILQDMAKIQVGIQSYGPRLEDKTT